MLVLTGAALTITGQDINTVSSLCNQTSYLINILYTDSTQMAQPFSCLAPYQASGYWTINMQAMCVGRGWSGGASVAGMGQGKGPT